MTHPPTFAPRSPAWKPPTTQRDALAEALREIMVVRPPLRAFDLARAALAEAGLKSVEGGEGWFGAPR